MLGQLTCSSRRSRRAPGRMRRSTCRPRRASARRQAPGRDPRRARRRGNRRRPGSSAPSGPSAALRPSRAAARPAAPACGRLLADAEPKRLLERLTEGRWPKNGWQRPAAGCCRAAALEQRWPRRCAPRRQVGRKSRRPAAAGRQRLSVDAAREQRKGDDDWSAIERRSGGGSWYLELLIRAEIATHLTPDLAPPLRRVTLPAGFQHLQQAARLDAVRPGSRSPAGSS